MCVRVCVCLSTYAHTCGWFSWKFLWELLTPGEALKRSERSIKSLWSLSTARSSNSHHLSVAIGRVVWKPVKSCDLLLKVTIRRNRTTLHMTKISEVWEVPPSQVWAHDKQIKQIKHGHFCTSLKMSKQHLCLYSAWVYPELKKPFKWCL